MRLNAFRWGRTALIPLAVAGALVVACTDEEEPDTDTGTEATATEGMATATGTAAATGTATATATATEAATETATPTEAAEGETVEVTMVDYAFEGLPDEVSVGTTFTVVNESTAELHELVAIRLPDEETRSTEELLQLPPEEIEAIASGEPAMVLIAMPGEEGMAVVGDGTFTEPGRYAIVCFIPTGADPQAYTEAAESSEGDPPQVEGGPPHVVQGMYGEVTVTE